MCPCGKTKPKIAWAKCDASQFFKDASTQRGTLRAQHLFDRIHGRKKNAIAVCRGKKAKGFLCTENRVVPFKHVLQGLDFARTDVFFALGQEVVARKRGWPMGGSMSEPATLADLGEDIHFLYADQSRAETCGFSFQGRKTAELVEGLLYVDDNLVFSKTFCSTCLYNGVKKLFPGHMGFTLEGENLLMQYLQARILQNGGHFVVLPFSVNDDFSEGNSPHPKIARLADYTMRIGWLSKDGLRTFMLGKILVFNRICEGSWVRGEQATISIAMEVMRQHWPIKWMAKPCRTYQKDTDHSIRMWSDWHEDLLHMHMVGSNDFKIDEILCICNQAFKQVR